MIDKLVLCTKALRLRRELGVDTNSPVDIFSLAHKIPRLTLVFYPMGDRLSGICIKNNGSPVIAINSSMSVGRQRFSMAHELFHLYFDENEYTAVSSMRIGCGNEVEKAADQFASFFLMPPIALSEAIEQQGCSENGLGINEIVRLEQYFGMSRQALLFRLVEDNKLTIHKADEFRQGVIRSAVNLGFDNALYIASPQNKQYETYGFYIQQAKEVYEKDLVSTGKYEQLLLSAFRADLVFGDEFEGEELND